MIKKLRMADPDPHTLMNFVTATDISVVTIIYVKDIIPLLIGSATAAPCFPIVGPHAVATLAWLAHHVAGESAQARVDACVSLLPSC